MSAFNTTNQLATVDPWMDLGRALAALTADLLNFLCGLTFYNPFCESSHTYKAAGLSIYHGIMSNKGFLIMERTYAGEFYLIWIMALLWLSLPVFAYQYRHSFCTALTAACNFLCRPFVRAYRSARLLWYADPVKGLPYARVSKRPGGVVISVDVKGKVEEYQLKHSDLAKIMAHSLAAMCNDPLPNDTPTVNEMSIAGSRPWKTNEPAYCGVLHSAPKGAPDLTGYCFGVLSRVKIAKRDVAVTADHVLAALKQSQSPVYYRKGGVDYPFEEAQPTLHGRSDENGLDLVFLDVNPTFWSITGTRAAKATGVVKTDAHLTIHTPDGVSWTKATGHATREYGTYKLAHTVSTQPGSSGSLVVDQKGRAIGIHLGSIPTQKLNRMSLFSFLLHVPETSDYTQEQYFQEREFDGREYDKYDDDTSVVWKDSRHTQHIRSKGRIIMREINSIDNPDWVPGSAWGDSYIDLDEEEEEEFLAQLEQQDQQWEDEDDYYNEVAPPSCAPASPLPPVPETSEGEVEDPVEADTANRRKRPRRKKKKKKGSAVPVTSTGAESSSSHVKRTNKKPLDSMSNFPSRSSPRSPKSSNSRGTSSKTKKTSATPAQVSTPSAQPLSPSQPRPSKAPGKPPKTSNRSSRASTTGANHREISQPSATPSSARTRAVFKLPLFKERSSTPSARRS